MIPKKIHYCWFGGNSLPKLAKKCIDSWKKFFPDYEIVEWNESNFDVNCCQYVKEAYEAKKWAFVSDYARFKILYENGGLYFDTDVEVIKAFDEVLDRGAFMGVESDKKGTVNPGLGLGVEVGSLFYKEMLYFYHERKFFRDNGEQDLTTIVEYTTNKLKVHGLIKTKKIQNVCGIHIYPQEYFSPKDIVSKKVKVTKNTLTIHHFSGTWLNDEDKFYLEYMEKNKNKPFNLLVRKYARFKAIKRVRGFKVAIKETFKKLF